MDRKALRREYKETRRPMGVFRVRNTSNNKSLIGSSTDLPAILNRHRFQLDAGLHPNKALQEDWHTYGSAAFAFEVLDTLKPPTEGDYDPTDDLHVLKEMWLEKCGFQREPGYK